MNWRGKSLLFLLLLQFTVFCSFSQNVHNFSYKIVGTTVEVRYDLVGEVNDEFKITLLSSADDFEVPLIQVSGDVGKSVKTGPDKLIIWDARTELGEFKGSISLKLRSSLVPIIEFTYPTTGTKFRRGKSYELTLTGGDAAENIQFELYKGQSKIKDLTVVALNSKWEWDIPKDLKSGKDYKIKTTTGGRTGYSSSFQISPKIPLVLKAVPFVLVGGIVYAIISSGSSEPATTNNNIADPFLPE